MANKIEKRLRRAQRVRRRIAGLSAQRLCVHRTPRHIYAQIIDAGGARVLASASTLEVEVRKELKNGGNAAAARLIGKRIAEKAKSAGVTRVAFDRSGYKYHGRVKALADAAREHGLEF
ncbi:MAG: 50S ribosomal protein L18 [Candidatus Muproteobacteria bacterium RIFCSPHIGHO2_02_FULL_65_16]|uniref:Large ribosomal subunit protein uL18 n=1 Tax=Candidatus Muproteobacteria bacterium RIFCSPHIGHO2_02_FULL_65_16 TaxID=1817766 RepID=A0A1F6TUR8_9PROT|nr:MAG: 50S ribosomal protein L18 [Candidatus Muproteobacteria bacterium RIFCSPHIGHO2_02_FULL_65_16]